MPSPPNLAAHQPHFHRNTSWKEPVRVATIATITLATGCRAGSVIDGTTLATGDRVLVKDQSDPTENGIYRVEVSGAPTRAFDMDVGTEFRGALIQVLEGTASGTLWRCTETGEVEVDVDVVSFVQYTPPSVESHVHVWQEDKSALCDGAETTFGLASAFYPATTAVFLNGLHQRPGVDYAEDSGLASLTFVEAPLAGDVLVVAYVLGTGSGGEVEPPPGGGGDPVITGAPYASDAPHAVLLLMQNHSHTTNSDGSLSPTALVAAYAAAGYDVLAISDHDEITTQPAGIDTAIDGNELSPSTVHILSLDSTYLRGGTTAAQTMIDGVIAGGGQAIINHANWSTGITYAELAALTGYLGIEIFNMHCEDLTSPVTYPGWAVTLWDQLLSNVRTNVWGFATDDFHNLTSRRAYDTGRLWVWAGSNTSENVMAALVNGTFVADVANYGVTPGWPTLTTTDISVECTGAVRIEAWGSAGLLDADDSDALTYTFVGDEQYVRLVAIGDYTEDFGAAIDTTVRWGVGSGTWSVGSGILSQTSTLDASREINLKRHIQGDFDVQVDLRLNAGSSNMSGGILFRAGNTPQYYLRLDADDDELTLWVKTGTYFSEPFATAAFTTAEDTWYRLRLQYEHATTTWRARVWAVGDAEPGTWAIEEVNATFDHGFVGLKARGAHDFDNLYVKGFRTFYQPVAVEP